MEINQSGIDLVKKFEGSRLNAYLDSVNVPTIGYGATFYENGNKVKIGDKISQQRADELLTYHLNLFAKGITPLITSKVNSNQFSALVSFAYNLGVGNLKNSTLLKKVNANPNDTSIRDEFIKWNRAGGNVLAGLTRRRNAEADLYFTV